MPGRFLCPLAVVLCALSASAQTVDKTFYLTHTNTHALQQIVNIIRSIGDIRDVTADLEKIAITVQAPSDQVALAAWLVNELDKVPEQPPAIVKHDYPAATAGNMLLRVFFLAHMQTPQALQEAVNAVRSNADVQRCFPYQELNAIVSRGSAEQVNTADWFLTQLDQPAQKISAPVTKDLPLPNDLRNNPNMGQILFLAHPINPLKIQQIVNAARSVSDLQRLFPFNSTGALLMRGTPDQIALADWVIKALDQPGPTLDSDVHEYKVPSSVWPDPSIARIFFLGSEQTPQSLQELTNSIRTATKMQRVYPNNFVNAITARGSGDQIAQAAELVKGAQ